MCRFLYCCYITMVKLLTPVFSIFRVLYFCIWYFERGLRAWNAVSSSPRNPTCQRLKQQDCPTDISCHIFLFWMFKYFMLRMSNFWILQIQENRKRPCVNILDMSSRPFFHNNSKDLFDGFQNYHCLLITEDSCIILNFKPRSQPLWDIWFWQDTGFSVSRHLIISSDL